MLGFCVDSPEVGGHELGIEHEVAILIKEEEFGIFDGAHRTGLKSIGLVITTSLEVSRTAKVAGAERTTDM